MKQHLRTFANWKLNESYEMGAGPKDGDIIKQLIAEVDKAIGVSDWREANRALRAFIEENEKALAQADGTEVIVALEPWFDTYKDDWQADAADFQEDDPLTSGDVESFEFEEEPENELKDTDIDVTPDEPDWD